MQVFIIVLVFFTLLNTTQGQIQQDNEQRVDMTVPQLKSSDLPSCPVQIVAQINLCVSNRYSDQKVKCARFNTGPAALPLLQQCQCEIAHMIYVCYNRPGCMAPLALTIPGANSVSNPPTGPDGMTNGLLSMIRQQKLVTGMVISQWCIAARASGVQNIRVVGDETFVDVDLGVDKNAKPFAETSLPPGVRLFSGAQNEIEGPISSLMAMLTTGIIAVGAVFGI